MERIAGVNAALLTPLDGGGEPLWSSIERNVAFLLGAGVGGLFPASSTGEFARLSLDQRKRLVERVARQAAGRVKLLPGCGAMTVAEVLELARHAHSAGCDAVIICPPYYYPLSGDEIEVFYRRVCDSSPLPVIPYNIPAFSSPIPLEVLARTARHPNVMAIKESSGDMLLLGALVRCLRNQTVEVLVGPDECLFPALALGAHGCASGCSGIFPELVGELLTTFRAGHYARARELQFLLLAVMREVHRLPFPYGLKAALEVRGIPMGAVCDHFTPPLRELYSEVKRRIGEILRESGAEVSVP